MVEYCIGTGTMWFTILWVTITKTMTSWLSTLLTAAEFLVSGSCSSLKSFLRSYFSFLVLVGSAKLKANKNTKKGNMCVDEILAKKFE